MGQFHYALSYLPDFFCQVFVQVNQNIKRLPKILRSTRQVFKPLNTGTAPSVFIREERGYAVEEEFAFYLPGDAPLMVHKMTLGVLYRTGIGVQKDGKEGVKWLQKDAEQGQVASQAMLSSMYLAMKECPKTRRKP